MSAPDYLFISETEEYHLPRRASIPLFDYMQPHMMATAPDYADQFEGGFYGGVLTITHYFMPVYHLMVQVCDDVTELMPAKASL